jgi:hypothetical protein
MRAELEGLVCSGAARGKKQTYALLDERAPASAARALSKDESLARLADIYFKSRSPATLQDFAGWAGLSLTEARQGLEAVKANFVAATAAKADDDKTYWINPEFADTYDAPPTAPSVLLLPAFDEYIIAYSDRRAVIPTNYSKAVSSNGIFHPTIVVNGQVVGIWKKPAGKTKPPFFEFFEKPDDNVAEAVTKAMNKLCAP